MSHLLKFNAERRGWIDSDFLRNESLSLVIKHPILSAHLPRIYSLNI